MFDREETLDYIRKLNNRKVFPVRTQFALIGQAFLISDQGEIILSSRKNTDDFSDEIHRSRQSVELGIPSFF